MERAKLKLGVVGVGHLGRHHARIYAGLPGVELVAVADRDLDRATRIAETHGCRAVSDVAGLAADVDAASVAVPTEDHRVVAEHLLRQGVDVLVEKPLARTLAEADAINRAAEQAGRLVMVGHTERFNPAVVALALAVDAPRFLEIHRLAAFTARSTDIDVVLDLMIHDLDLLLYLDGTRPVSVDAVGVAALTDQLDIKMDCIRCHRTQMAPDWPYDRVPREVAAAILGREYYIRARPPVQAGEQVSADFFHGLDLTSGD